MMTTYKECKFYIEGGKCCHEDAPKPYHSYCIGKQECGVWDDHLGYAADKPEPQKVED